MLNIVLFGPPGAGKGTQSQYLIDKYSLVHLSTGDLLRAEITAGTALGLKAKSLMDNGQLVPDEVVIGMIDNKLKSNTAANGFIFDGFPRTTPQAELTKRLLERGKTSGRADDQNEELIRNRVKEYNTKTAPVADYYAKQHKYSPIVGIGSIDEIFANICKVVDGLK